MSWCFWMMDGESNKETWTQRSELMFGQRKPVCFSSPLRRAGPTTVSPRSFHRPNLNTEMGRRDWVLSWHAALHPDAADWLAEWPRLICLREEKVSNLLLDAARKKNDSFEDTLAKTTCDRMWTEDWLLCYLTHWLLLCPRRQLDYSSTPLILNKFPKI